MATYALLDTLDLVEKSLEVINKEEAWSDLHFTTITLKSM